jgi:hypothetical protein
MLGYREASLYTYTLRVIPQVVGEGILPQTPTLAEVILSPRRN